MFKILPILLLLTTGQLYSQPYITPASQTVCYGDNYNTLTLQNNTKPIVRWEMSVTGSDPWITIINQTINLSFNDLTTNTWFRAVVRAEGELEQYSAAAVVNVSSKAVPGIISGTSNVCKGSNIGQLTLSGNQGSVTTWQYSLDNHNWYNIAGTAGLTSYTYNNLNQKTAYIALVQNGSGCAPLPSDSFVVKVDEPTVAGSLSGANTVCQGSNSGNVTLTGYTGNVVRWEYSYTGSAPWSDISETSSTLSYTNLLNPIWYRSVIKSGTCLALSATPVAITVNSPSSGGITSGANAVCSKINGGDIYLAGQQGTITKWSYSKDNGATWNDTTVTQPVLSYANLTQSRTYQAEVKNGVCPAASSTQTRITVYPLPTVTFTALSQNQGSPVTFTDHTTIASGNLKQFFWDFHDGSGSNTRNPIHTFENPGTYRIKLEVTSDKGCIDSTSNNLVINEVPQVNFVFSNICLKSEAHFLNTSAISYPTPTYQWNFGDGSPVSGDESPIHRYSAPGSYPVTLTVSTPFSSASKTQTIQVYYQTVPAFQATNVCLGSNTAFINKSQIHDGYLTYNWNFGDGKNSNDLNPIHSYDSPDVYTVRLITISNYNCSDTVYKDVYVNPMPIAKFSATDVPFGNPVVLKDSSSISQGNLKRSWSFGDGNTSDTQNPEHLYSSAGNYLVTLTVVSDSGCLATLSKMVWVFPKPHASFVVQPVCVYDSANFENQSTISSGSLSYYWQFGDAGSSTLKNPAWKYANPGRYIVTLVTKSDRNGLDTITKTLDIYPQPTAAFSAQNVCDGFAMTFQNQSSITTGSIVSYLWDFGDGGNAVRQSPSKLYLNPGSYNVLLSIASDKNCKASVTHTVTVYSNPVANFTVAGVCFKQQIFPINLSQGADNGNFEWTMGDGSSYGVFAPTHVYANPGIFGIKLKITDLNGCVDSLSRNVTIYSLPPVDAGRDTTIVMGFPIQLNGNGGETFQWYPSDGLSSVFVKNPTANPLVTTTYYLTAQDQYGCINRDSMTITVEDHHIIMASNVVTPDGNGKNDTWHIQNIETYPEAEVTIFNRWGTIVFHTKNYQNDWGGTNGKHDILPDGAYYYVIKIPGSAKIYKGSVTIMRNK